MTMGKQHIKKKKKVPATKDATGLMGDPSTCFKILETVHQGSHKTQNKPQEPYTTSTPLYFQVFSTLFLQGNSSVLSEQKLEGKANSLSESIDPITSVV